MPALRQGSAVRSRLFRTPVSAFLAPSRPAWTCFQFLLAPLPRASVRWPAGRVGRLDPRHVAWWQADPPSQARPRAEDRVVIGRLLLARVRSAPSLSACMSRYRVRYAPKCMDPHPEEQRADGYRPASLRANAYSPLPAHRRPTPSFRRDLHSLGVVQQRARVAIRRSVRAQHPAILAPARAVVPSGSPTSRRSQRVARLPWSSPPATPTRASRGLRRAAAERQS